MDIQLDNPTFSKAARDSVATSATERRPLLFRKQALTAISPDLGTIQLQIRHVRRARHAKVTTRTDRGDGNYKPQILNERSKKAIGHSVQLGPEFQSRRNTSIETHLVEELVIFVFKYRPIGILHAIFQQVFLTCVTELLRAEGIAPPAAKEERAVFPMKIVDLTMDAEEDDEHDAEIRKLEVNSNSEFSAQRLSTHFWSTGAAWGTKE
ncbi:hypothetical protein DFH07DRAFT_772253 [Mycena maculata]|uniref:Uncharacterized protein n=1 Tax=Mycena maculata TaxID=230809 RepID=A0AAD7NG24_9AGAR|nr:hypothetical protein DFH07DRAFT_772253 [Mycena maculata]